MSIHSVSVYIGLCLAMLWSLTGCAPKGRVAWEQAFTDTLYIPRYARGFCLTAMPGRASTLLTIQSPWLGAKEVKQHYFIARGGESAPEGFDGLVLPGEARRIVCLSSTYVGMLDELGEVSRVVGVSGRGFIANEYVRTHPEQVKDVGAEMNYEVLLGLRPDLVMIYGVEDAQTSMTDKLKELSIPYIYIGEYLEDTPLGRAEWLTVVAELIGQREAGQRQFDRIESDYEQVRARVAGVAHRPTVMLNTPWNDAWVIPHVNGFVPRFVRDAGAEYIFTEDSPEHDVNYIGMEVAYALLHKADYWLHPGQATSLADLRAMNPRFAEAKAFRTGRVYNNNRRLTAVGGNDFFESSVVRPDRVLRDLIAIFHPEVTTDTLYYYRRLE